MQSMASLMSTTNNNDIATLEDFDEDEEKDSESFELSNSLFEGIKMFLIFPFLLAVDDSKDSIAEVAGITSQLEMLTNSLSGSDFTSTPISGTCLIFVSKIVVNFIEEIPDLFCRKQAPVYYHFQKTT